MSPHSNHSSTYIGNSALSSYSNHSSYIGNSVFNSYSNHSSYLGNSIYNSYNNHFYNQNSSITNDPSSINQSSSTKNCPVVSSPNLQNMKICYLNARSIVNKAGILSHFIVNEQKSSYDMVFITETWLNDHIVDALICPPGYQIMRNDRRNGKKGGGVLVLYKNHLQVVDLTSNVFQDFEHLCVDLISNSKRSSTKLRFCCCYFPPSLSVSHTEVSKICTHIQRYCLNSPLILLGDFNFPKIDWTTLTGSTKSERVFIDFCINAGLQQHVTSSTLNAHSGSTLDLVLTNTHSSNLLISLEVLPPLSSTSDHNTIVFEVKTNGDAFTSREKPTYFQYNKGNYEKICEILQFIDWDLMINFHKSVKTIYNVFLGIMHQLFKEYIPIAKVRPKNRTSKKITRLAKEKKLLYKKLKSDRTLKSQYKMLSKQYDKEVKAWNEITEQRICETKDQKYFYKYINKKLNSHNEIPPLKLDDGTLMVEDIDKANHLNDAFQSVFTAKSNGILSLESKTTERLDEISFTEADIVKAINKLQPKTSRTPDDIAPIVIKKIYPFIIPFLKRFFKLCFDKGELPDQWKLALVTPIFKKGCKNKASNYRPISLTSILCRLMEYIIKEAIINYLIKNNLLSDNQHGFLPNRSTTTQLLQSLNDWTENLDNGETIDVIYTDLAKAFDKVTHDKLIKVVESFGITGKALNWIRQFLTNRHQKVYIGTAESTLLEVHSGVPQGSVLGPLLFLLYIDDIRNTSHSPYSNIKLFADDCKVYSKVQSDLQLTLDNITQFTLERDLVLAKHKCYHLQIGKNSSDTTFKLGDHTVEKCNEMKDLGVIIQGDLKWKSHINLMCRKAYQKCYLIFRAFSSNNIWMYIKLFITFVRPTLEYNSTIWNPNLLEDIRKVESVQQYYLRTLCKRCRITSDSYSDRLYKLNMKTLIYRRLSFDLIMVYKIVRNLIDLPFEKFFTFKVTNYNLRRHKYHLEAIKFDKNVRKYFFFHKNSKNME